MYILLYRIDVIDVFLHLIKVTHIRRVFIIGIQIPAASAQENEKGCRESN